MNRLLVVGILLFGFSPFFETKASIKIDAPIEEQTQDCSLYATENTFRANVARLMCILSRLNLTGQDYKIKVNEDLDDGMSKPEPPELIEMPRKH